MTGSLKIKNDTFYAVINLKENGKYKQKWISTKLKVKGNKRKATEILNKIMAEYEAKETQPSTDDILFTDYLTQWLEKKKDKVELTTWEGYYNTVINHFIPYFKPLNLTIKEVKPKHIVNYYDYKFSGGRQDHKKGGLAFSSLKKHSVILKNILNQAFLEEIIPRNPALKIPLPKKDDGENKNTFLTASQANELLKLFKGHRLQPIIYMTLYYGLRRGEVIGLKWSAIDLKNNKVKINHIVTRTLTIVEKDRPKTVSSKREYGLLPEIKEMLLEIRVEQNYNKKLFGKNYYNSDYVFTWEDGKPYDPGYITKAFQKVLTKNNFPKMRFHDLRHSCASILYDKGWELKDIQTWLGHADIQTTANIYTHISKSRKEFMAKDLAHTFAM